MLFAPFTARKLALKNRAVMSPLTRSRAVEANVPNALMAEYYAQRATAGLIISEGTSPSPNGLGYARIPGMCGLPRSRRTGWACGRWSASTRPRLLRLRPCSIAGTDPGALTPAR
jgi:N-ethylmaleimide reductase